MPEVVQRRATLRDFAPKPARAAAELLASLQAPEKSIPSRLLYDARGVELFEAICETEEYYLTRTELGILRENVREMTELIGPRSLLIEYGSGSGLKTRLLLDHLQTPVAYVPIEILARSPAEVHGGAPRPLPGAARAARGGRLHVALRAAATT